MQLVVPGGIKTVFIDGKDTINANREIIGMTLKNR